MSLAKEYKGMFGSEALEIPEGAVRQEEVAERHRKLVFELNRSGKYLEMKERLKKSVVAIVKEKFRRCVVPGAATVMLPAARIPGKGGQPT